MAERFAGTINVDIRDSEPDWAPFEPPKAPPGAPSVVYIVLDDVGFSAMSSYGGPIETPNIDRIVDRGVRYTQFHTTALCSPTRSCLLTGRNHTRNSMACITEAAIGFPNASGTIPPENGMLSEILGELGWNTYMVGKWHLCPTDEMNLASTRRNWPTGRGFERWYGFLGAETNQWYPDLVYDNHLVDQPRLPEEGYHLTDDLTDKAIEFIKDAKAVAPEKPFFLYYAPGACHAPHHAPKEWIDKFKGRFDMGYEAMREQTLARQKKLGIVPADTTLPPVNPIGTPETRTGPDGLPFPVLDHTLPWDALGDDEKRLFARMAEVYAGFLAHADHHIGRLLDYLEDSGQLDNTILVVVSDNGASGEGGPTGSVNEMKFANGVEDDLAENLAKIDDLGGPRTYNHYPNGWAMAFNTPFKMWKRYEFNGGSCDPCIIAAPGAKARGEIRSQYHHAIDIVPTLLDLLGVEAPETIKGHVQTPFDGVTMRGSLEEADAPSTRTTQFYSMLGSRAIWHEGWKAVTTHPTIAGWGHFNDDEWQLYNTEIDRSEVNNLAAKQPGEAARARQRLVCRGRGERSIPARRPRSRRDHDDAASAAHGTTLAVRLLPGHRARARVALGQHARTVICDRRPHRHPGARRGGHPLRTGVAVRRPCPVCEERPPPLRQQLRRQRESRSLRIEDVPVGENVFLSASFEKDGQEAHRTQRHPLAVLRRRESRRRPGQHADRVRSRSPAQACTSGATTASR